MILLVLDGGIVMFLFLYISSLLYLTLHLECFEVEQICFSFLMVHVYFGTACPNLLNTVNLFLKLKRKWKILETLTVDVFYIDEQYKK